MADPLLVTMPLHLTGDMLRAVRQHPTTSCEDKDTENTRIGWLLCAWDVLVEQAQRAAGMPPTRQYYYKVDRCQAAVAAAADCICWHDEGTGPLADSAVAKTWRAKPIADVQEVPRG